MNQMANMRCKVCNKKGCFVTTQRIMSKAISYYCSEECAIHKVVSDRIDFTNREIKGFTNLRDAIKANIEDWGRILPFVYGWLMFYLALKRRDTRSRLKHLFDLAIKKNQEVFADVDGDKEFKEENPSLLIALTKYLVKANRDIAEEFIDFFATTDSATETI